MHAFANPARFLSLARPLTGLLFWTGTLIALAGLAGGLFLTPQDYLQHQSVRIMYVHVPAAWLGMAGWVVIAGASAAEIVWRHPLAAVAARAAALPGALFTAICLATGSLWGRPTWGTWWQWDGRLTSMLVMLFLYIAYLALAGAAAERSSGDRVTALFGLAGAIDLPIIHYSVLWWHTLHQGPSISLAGSSIDGRLLWPLPLALIGFTFIFGAILLMRMRTLLAGAKLAARLRRLAAA